MEAPFAKQNDGFFQSSGKRLPNMQKALCVLRYIHELNLWHIHSKWKISLLVGLCTPSSKKSSGEQSQISYAHSQKVVWNNTRALHADANKRTTSASLEEALHEMQDQ